MQIGVVLAILVDTTIEGVAEQLGNGLFIELRLLVRFVLILAVTKARTVQKLGNFLVCFTLFEPHFDCLAEQFPVLGIR